VLGAAGQVGRCLVRVIEAAADLELAFAVTRAELDLADPSRIERWLDRPGATRPDVVVNAAAFTKVDACESQVELAERMNARMPGEWARSLRGRGIRFLHLSTDYVFAGDGIRPYREDDPTGPRCVYGVTKRAGEQNVLEWDPAALIVRTSWVFGPGRNFVVAILDQAHKRRIGESQGPLRVVDDQRGCPTSAADLAGTLVEIIRRDRQSGTPLQGFLHLCNAGVTTWFGFARAILDQTGHGDLLLEPVATGAFPTAAPRPAYSVLDTTRAAELGFCMRPWTEALAGYLAGPDRPTHLITNSPGSGPIPAGSDSSAGPVSPGAVGRKVSH
jgi:dTDP-4-dehydrorhamnose reductase